MGLGELQQIRRQVSYEEGLALAQSKNILFIESSAKNAVNVDEAFQAAADIICDKVDCGKIDLDDDVSFWEGKKNSRTA